MNYYNLGACYYNLFGLTMIRAGFVIINLIIGTESPLHHGRLRYYPAAGDTVS